MKHLRNKRGLAGFGTLAAVIGVTLWIVLPALAASSGAPASPPVSIYNSTASSANGIVTSIPTDNQTGVMPVDLPIGGNGNCTPSSNTNLFGTVSALQGMREYDNSNPQTSNDNLSGNPDNATFSLTVSGTNKQQALLIESQNAAIYAIGINGGTDSTAYDYTGLDYNSTNSGASQGTVGAQGWVTADGNLHAPVSKTDSSGNPTQWYQLSHLTICYRPLVTITGQAYLDQGGNAGPGINGLTATAYDSNGHIVSTDTTHTDTQGTGTVGVYSLSVPAGPDYTVCMTHSTSNPAADYEQDYPTSAQPDCTSLNSTNAQAGYDTGTLSPTGAPTGAQGLDFGFLQYGSISGTVSNGNDANDSVSNWQIALYKNTGPSSSPSFVHLGTILGDGTYQFDHLTLGTQYTVCIAPDTGTWAQTTPAPNDADNCTPLRSVNTAGDVTYTLLPKGQTFTPSATNLNDPNTNFDNVAATDCNNLSYAPDATVDYTVYFPDCTLKFGQTFVFGKGTTSDDKPWVSLAAGDQSGAYQSQPLVEYVQWPEVLNADGTFEYTKLYYNDTPSPADPLSFDASKLSVMPACLVDPRTTATGTTLSSSPTDYTTIDNKGQVLPTINNTLATSCVISENSFVDPSKNVWFYAYVYSTADGLRSPG